MSQTIEKPRTGGPGSGLGGSWRVIVLNDDHNTFEHVAATLARYIPGMNLDKGYAAGQKEPAELYWEQLSDAGLTMAPLEQG
jgi:ATP-dependent Clp protease adaptor protein ClpS